MRLASRTSSLIIAAALALTPHWVIAANDESVIRYLPGSKAGEELQIAAVEVNGPIGPDSPVQLRKALSLALRNSNMRHNGGAPMVPVYLNSQGGQVASAILMGSLIRQLGASTWIRPDAKCASACVLILAGGVERLVFDRGGIGIHRPYFPSEQFAKLDRGEAHRRYAKLQDSVATYLRAMGVSDRLFERMLQVPSNKIEWLSESEATEYRLIGIDPAFSEWDRANMKERYRPEYVEWNDKFDDCTKTKSLEECLVLVPHPAARPNR